MITLLRVDIDREWTSDHNMVGTARFEKDKQEFEVKLSHKDCQDIADLIDRKLIAVAQERTTAQIEVLKNV